jgi:hypothetical protein
VRFRSEKDQSLQVSVSSFLTHSLVGFLNSDSTLNARVLSTGLGVCILNKKVIFCKCQKRNKKEILHYM